MSDGVYQWARTGDEARELSHAEFRRLMEGFTVESSIRTYQKIDKDSPESRP